MPGDSFSPLNPFLKGKGKTTKYLRAGNQSKYSEPVTTGVSVNWDDNLEIRRWSNQMSLLDWQSGYFKSNTKGPKMENTFIYQHFHTVPDEGHGNLFFTTEALAEANSPRSFNLLAISFRSRLWIFKSAQIKLSLKYRRSNFSLF